MEAAADEEKPLIHHLSPQDDGLEHTSDGTVDINKQPARRRSTGNWRACYFILGAAREQCRRREERVDLDRQLLLHAAHRSLLGRHILGEIPGNSSLPFSLYRWDAGYDIVSVDPGADALFKHQRNPACHGLPRALPRRLGDRRHQAVHVSPRGGPVRHR
ncbi:unnamed protein product [Triticum turgidum subsp. durum]|uniref:Uncharacterized protein n=1 Tax=Triticum turgidum subsp. durum TaxID=4567 RepID=A0A9R0Y9X5_TRITD|nr:unnamed protein product [Triticum turgidum subsp. durum]